MSEIIKMNYAAMQNMQGVFMRSASECETLVGDINTIAQQLADGALLGQAGERFSDLLRSKLGKSVGNLGAKYSELASDIAAAMQFLKASDEGSAGKF
jgi:uncharacterized protein YukE